MWTKAKTLVRRMAETLNCPACGSASYYHDGQKNICMDCSNQWT